MNNPRLAGRYAKSLVDLATEQGQMEPVYNDMKLLQGLFKSNADFVALLRSPIINADKKEKIVRAVLVGKLAPLTDAFLSLLVRKGRESNLPEITEAFIDQYNGLNSIYKVKISTAVPMSEELKQSIINQVKSEKVKTVELETVVKDELIGGFVLEMQGNLVDASVLRDLKDVKKQFMNNDYIHKLR
jgi:F-type H+-transporting ATPase subunit delta